VNDLKDLIRKQLESQKENIARSNQIQKVIDEAITKAKFTVPQIMVEQDVAKKEHDYKHRIEDLGLKLDDFLKTQKTTMEEMKKGWQEEAEKQIQTDLLLFEIAKAQELKVTNEEISAEIDAITDSKLKEQYDSLEGRNYVSSIILQQKAINWLAEEVGISQKESKE
jgi:trigger factor